MISRRIPLKKYIFLIEWYFGKEVFEIKFD